MSLIIPNFNTVIGFKGRSPVTLAIELPRADTLPLQQIFNFYILCSKSLIWLYVYKRPTDEQRQYSWYFQSLFYLMS